MSDIGKFDTIYKAILAAASDSNLGVAKAATIALRKLSRTDDQEQTALTNIASGSPAEKIEAIEDLTEILKDAGIVVKGGRRNLGQGLDR